MKLAFCPGFEMIQFRKKRKNYVNYIISEREL